MQKQIAEAACIPVREQCLLCNLRTCSKAVFFGGEEKEGGGSAVALLLVLLVVVVVVEQT